MPEKLMKWQKEFLLFISRKHMSDKEMFKLIHSRYGEFGGAASKDHWKEKQIVSEFRKRMGW